MPKAATLDATASVAVDIDCNPDHVIDLVHSIKGVDTGRAYLLRTRDMLLLTVLRKDCFRQSVWILDM